jgi:transglutaminase-like putative cysteine protease
MTFDIPAEHDVQLRTWVMKTSGNIRISIVASNGETVFQKTAGLSGETTPIHLAAGHYRVMFTISNAFYAGGAEGVNFLSYYFTQIPILPDTDLDGLPDEMEKRLGTNPNLADTDGDSLSDYAEVVKYKTNPLKEDSDGDGVPENDWKERREYAYTIRVLMRIREPFDPKAMDDLYQDARVVAGPDAAGYTTLEAIIYPETHPVLAASAYPLKNLPEKIQSLVRPGIATNYDALMQAKVHDLTAGAATDVQAVGRILEWVRKNTTPYLDYSIPEVYFTYLDGGQVRVRNYHESLPVDELLQTHYFAASMFRARTHGTCTSIATLKCAMLKAAGIPCQLIQTIFPIYYHGSQTEPYTNNLRRKWDDGNCSYEQPAGASFETANHAFLEVYLGNQWVRVDEDLGVFQQRPRCLGLKILSVADWSEVDFSETWPVDWIHQRPYYTMLLEDQEPQF